MTTTPTPTRPPEAARINPRIRERLIEVRREAGRRRLRILLVISSVICVGGVAFLTVTSPMLDVDRIDVVGGGHMSAAQLRAASGVHVHDHLLFVDTGAAARRLEQLPWIERATVKRDLPGTLKISVVEYTAAAYVRVPGAVVLVASNGHVIARAPRRRPGRSKCAVFAARRMSGNSSHRPMPRGLSVAFPKPSRVRSTRSTSAGAGSLSTSRAAVRSCSATRPTSTRKLPPRWRSSPSKVVVRSAISTSPRPTARPRMIDSHRALRYSLDAKHRLT